VRTRAQNKKPTCRAGLGNEFHLTRERNWKT
jgi:hypothetical protein